MSRIRRYKMDISEYFKMREAECKRLKTIADLQQRIDETYKSIEKFRKLRDKDWVINNRRFAEIIVKAMYKLNKEVEYE